MSDNKFITIISIYLIGLFITFGNAFNHIECDASVNCINKELGSFISAVFWPAYWSVRLQE